MLIVSALLHEAGHLLALAALGARTLSIRLGLNGICISYHTGGLRPIGECAALAAGPAVNAVAAVVSIAVYDRSGSGAALTLAGVNAVLCVFNLLPALPLDGGKLLGVFCDRLAGERAAEAVLFLSGMGMSSTLLFLAWRLAKRGILNPFLLTAGVFFALQCCQGRKSDVK